MEPILVVFREERDRWFPGDLSLRRAARHVLGRAPAYPSSMQRVVGSFLKGLREAGIPYRLNPRPRSISRGAKVISFGLGRLGVEGLPADTRIIAAVGFPYPTAFPDLCDRYDVRLFLQHSPLVIDWFKAANIYPDGIFDLWPAGIDTEEWAPDTSGSRKDIDVLLYEKPGSERDHWDEKLVEPIKAELRQRGLSFHSIRYGRYSPTQYKSLLARSNALIFLSRYETQGLAYQESLSCGVPVLAWNPGRWHAPPGSKYATEPVQATSVPFFDARCGATFKNVEEFAEKLGEFYHNCRQSTYDPRQYIIENLTISHSTKRLLALYSRV